MAEKQLRFKQVSVGQYNNSRTGLLSFVVIGLSEDGKVYQFKSGKWQSLEGMFGGQTQSSESNVKSMTVNPDPAGEPEF